MMGAGLILSIQFPVRSYPAIWPGECSVRQRPESGDPTQSSSDEV